MNSRASTKSGGTPTVGDTTSLLVVPDATSFAPGHEESINHIADYGTTGEASISGAASESTSLLKSRDLEDEDGPIDGEQEDEPLPLGKIALLCLARMIDPMSFFCIFPFVNQMIFDTGTIPEEEVGFYSGLIESLFSVCQMATMIFWGRASDRFGRKPILVGSLVGGAITVSLFGFSQNVQQMIAFRCLAGTFNGSVVTIRAMFTDISTKRTQGRAFSYFAFSGNVGIFLGPVIGGGLSKLAQHYPSVFGGNWFLERFPYALPTLFMGCLAAVTAVVTALFVEETLNQNTRDNKGQTVKPLPTWDLVKSDGVIYVLYLSGVIAIMAFAYTAVAPVFWFEPPDKGGFGFDERLISIFLALAGVSQALWLLFVFPPLQHRIGTGGVLRICSRTYPFLFLLNPLLNLFLRKGWRTAFWAIGPVLMVIGSGVSMNFTAIQLAINDIAPSANTMGTLNALALTLSSGIRACTPALFTSLYAVGVKLQILWGQMIWLIMIVIATIMAISLHWLPKQVDYVPAQQKSGSGDAERQDVHVGQETDAEERRTSED